MNTSYLHFGLLLLAASFFVVDSFVTPVSSPKSLRLQALSEWRDEVDVEDPFSMKKQVPMHLVPSSDVALPGETKYFQFQTEAELRLFQQAMDRHHGIFGLGLVVSLESLEAGGESMYGDAALVDRELSQDEETMLETIALMEIVEYKNMNLGVDFGVFCTAQVVGRASVLTMKDYEGNELTESAENNGPLVAECLEYFDEAETHFTLQEVNTMAKDVVETIARISEQEASQLRNDDDDNDDDDTELRTDRFQKSLRDAYIADSQGYIMPSSAITGLRSWKELNVISWAAFSSSMTKQWEETHRLYAFDMQRAVTRLQLASFWLSDVLVDAQKAARQGQETTDS
ncbi:MAG: hypothetical protein SGILL_008523 [Bacillariaceae sp.]